MSLEHKIEDDVLQSNNGVWKVSKAGIEQEFQEDHWQIRGKINDEQLAQFDSAVKKNILGFNDYF